MDGNRLRRLTDRLIPDDAVFLLIFKAGSPRIASYVKDFHNVEEEQKDPQGGMRVFGNRLNATPAYIQRPPASQPHSF